MGYVQLTDDVLEELRRIREETGVGPMKFLRHESGVPDGLSSPIIVSWMRGASKRARKRHLEFVLERWPKVIPILPITDEIQTEIVGHLDRTGFNYRALIAKIPDRPDKLDDTKIMRWVKGYARNARKDELDAVLKTLRALPDCKPGLKKTIDRRSVHSERREFTKADGLALEAERARTGVQTAELLKYFYRGKVPEGLSAGLISSWINGSPRTVSAELYDWTLKAWKALPDAQ
ncbi:hypothetical protein [Maricaulis sp.]|uniref:hypothetical protein n=1 Tax=Maricaulis sp. TaxID=1486257 RepID=UPI00261CFB67|nr:hypothetical protein [Maricaulis sp.]